MKGYLCHKKDESSYDDVNAWLSPLERVILMPKQAG
jgi:hypothetical protein